MKKGNGYLYDLEVLENLKDEKWWYNQNILADVKRGETVKYTEDVISYARKYNLITILETALDRFDIPAELSLQERITYYDLFVKNRHD